MKISAVEMVRKIRDRHYGLLKNKDVKDQLAFYREQARLLEDRLACTGKKTGTRTAQHEAARYDGQKQQTHGRTNVQHAAEPDAEYCVKRAAKGRKGKGRG